MLHLLRSDKETHHECTSSEREEKRANVTDTVESFSQNKHLVMYHVLNITRDFKYLRPPPHLMNQLSSTTLSMLCVAHCATRG